MNPRKLLSEIQRLRRTFWMLWDVDRSLEGLERLLNRDSTVAKVRFAVPRVISPDETESNMATQLQVGKTYHIPIDCMNAEGAELSGKVRAGSFSEVSPDLAVLAMADDGFTIEVKGAGDLSLTYTNNGASDTVAFTFVDSSDTSGSAPSSPAADDTVASVKIRDDQASVVDAGAADTAAAPTSGTDTSDSTGPTATTVHNGSAADAAALPGNA